MGVLGRGGRLSFISASRSGTELTFDAKDFYRRENILVGTNTVEPSAQKMAKHLQDISIQFSLGQLKASDEQELNLVGLDQIIDAYASKKKTVIVFPA